MKEDYQLHGYNPAITGYLHVEASTRLLQGNYRAITWQPIDQQEFIFEESIRKEIADPFEEKRLESQDLYRKVSEIDLFFKI
jgi:hypothetical protein